MKKITLKKITLNKKNIILLGAIFPIIGFGLGYGFLFLVPEEMTVSSQFLDYVVDAQNISILKSAELSSNVQSIIEQASIGFGIGSFLQDPDSIPNTEDEFFVNGIDECRFHSAENIERETCVICALTNSQGVEVAQGRVDLPQGYTASDTLEIQITDFELVENIDVKNIQGVAIGICNPPTQGCSQGYWKQSQHFDSWTNHSPNDSFKTTFGLGPTDSITLSTGGSDPTLLQALQSGGGGINHLARESVGALLNANAGISYPLAEADVISQFQNAFVTGDNGSYNAQADFFESLNDSTPDVECPLN